MFSELSFEQMLRDTAGLCAADLLSSLLGEGRGELRGVGDVAVDEAVLPGELAAVVHEDVPRVPVVEGGDAREEGGAVTLDLGLALQLQRPSHTL